MNPHLAESLRASLEAAYASKDAAAADDTTSAVATVVDTLAGEADRVTATVRRRRIHGSRNAVTSMLNEEFVEQRFRDVWVLRAGAWLLERSDALGSPVEGSVDAAPPSSPRLAQLRTEIASGSPAALEAFWAEMTGSAPLVEPHADDPRLCLVTYVLRSREDRPYTVGGGLMWDGIDKPLARLAASDVWHLTEALPATGRFNYWFRVREHLDWPREAWVTRDIDDPLNSRTREGANWFELPDAPAQPYSAVRPGVSAGCLIRDVLHSQTLGEDRPYSIYLPAGHGPDSGPVGLLVLFDGEIYGGDPEPCVATPTILDNLIADGKIPPIAALLVHNLPGRRAQDLLCSPEFEAFVALELVPLLQQRYRAGLAPEHTVAAGSSNGGVAAVWCGLCHPDVFGKVLSMSGAFSHTADWPPASSFPFGGGEGMLMREFSASPRLPLRFWFTVGRFELLIQLLTGRHLRSVLELKGYPVTYSEFDGGHTYSAWRGSLAEGLIALLGADGPANPQGGNP